MNFRHLKYFVAVARCRSFSRASAELHIAQPALSSQIAALEDELALQLFTRHSRGVELTLGGSALLTRAEQILGLLETARLEMLRFRPDISGEIRLGVATTMTAVLAQPLIDTMQQRYPELTLQVVEGMSGHLEKWLEHDDIDIAIMFHSPQGYNPPLTPLGFERLVLIGPADDDLAHRSEVRMDDVTALPMIHSTKAHQLRQLIETYLLAQKQKFKLVAEIDSLAQIKSLVFQTRGYTVLPRTSVSPDWVNGKIRFWPITDPGLYLTLFLVPSHRFRREAHYGAVIAFLEDEIRNLIVSGGWTGATIQSTPEG